MVLSEGLSLYERRVSCMKKGYPQEKYRISHLSRSELGSKEINAITSVDIATHRDARLMQLNPKTGRRITPATVRLELALLSHFFDLAKLEFGICDIANPCLLVRKPKPSRGRERRLRRGEERAIKNYCSQYGNTELMSIIDLALTTAMRLGELITIQWENISFRSRTVHLPDTKNGSARNVPLSRKALSVLRAIGPRPCGQVFRYTAHGFKSVWRTMIKRLGIEDLHFHDLRHEATSRLFELGTLDLMEVAAITGHKSLAMLKRYTHLKAQKLVNKLDSGRKLAQRIAGEYFAPQFGFLKFEEGYWKARFPDFEPELTVTSCDRNELLVQARNQVAMLLIEMMTNGENAPTTGDDCMAGPNEEMLTVEFGLKL